MTKRERERERKRGLTYRRPSTAFAAAWRFVRPAAPWAVEKHRVQGVPYTFTAHPGQDISECKSGSPCAVNTSMRVSEGAVSLVRRHPSGGPCFHRVRAKAAYLYTTITALNSNTKLGPF